MVRSKKNTEEQVPTELNSKDDDAEYQEIMLSTPQTYSVTYAPVSVDTISVPEISIPAASQNVSSIYLVEGKIRLDQDGLSPIFSDQRRVINAFNIDEALQTFTNYFVGMSNPVQRYTVVTATALETIL